MEAGDLRVLGLQIEMQPRNRFETEAHPDAGLEIRIVDALDRLEADVAFQAASQLEVVLHPFGKRESSVGTDGVWACAAVADNMHNTRQVNSWRKVQTQRNCNARHLNSQY